MPWLHPLRQFEYNRKSIGENQSSWLNVWYESDHGQTINAKSESNEFTAKKPIPYGVQLDYHRMSQIKQPQPISSAENNTKSVALSTLKKSFRLI